MEQTPLTTAVNAAEMVDMGALLAEISARLVTVGRQSLSDASLATVTRKEQEHRILVFRLAQTHYAVTVSSVREVVRDPSITRIPGLPDWVLGVTNLHGDITSVVDLSLFLGIDSDADSRKRSMLVTQSGDQQIGLVVDEVDLITSIAADQIISPPFTIDAALVAYLRGAVERESEFIRLLDCDRLLLGNQMQQFS
jgi:chemotaxis signal transduction protein